MSQQQNRRWVVQRGVYDDGAPESEDDFRDRVQRKLADVEATGHMIGGAFYLRPVRAEVAPDQWETVAWHVQWITEGAARRATGEFDRQRQPEPQVESEPEPVGVGVGEDTE